MNVPGSPEPYDDEDGPGRPRIPTPRSSVEDTGRPLPEVARRRWGQADQGGPVAAVLPHDVLKSLLGAWALAACSPPEALAVEEHLGDCGPCAEEALRLRGAVGLLHPAESLDLDPGLRGRVLDGCLDRRPPQVPVPSWAASYDAETARLDALLQDIGEAEWHAPIRLRWYEDDAPVGRRTTVAAVIAHLLAVDGLVAVVLGLDDPLGKEATDDLGPDRRTERLWRTPGAPPTSAVREPWREQSHHLVRTASFAVPGSGRLPVSYGDFALPLRDAMLERAFECWIHAEDIAEAIDYPYEPPAPRHLHPMIDLAARQLPGALATRRRRGRGGRALRPAPAGEPGRTLRLEIEGAGGGHWLIPLDSAAAADAVGPPVRTAGADTPSHEVAHVALDGVEFCRLAAGHVPPEEAAAGRTGDHEAISEVLFAAASLSRL